MREPSNFGCSQEFIEFANIVLEENNIEISVKMPKAKKIVS